MPGFNYDSDNNGGAVFRNGEWRIEITGRPSPTRGGGSSGGRDTGPGGEQMVIHNGQTGYWSERVTGSKNEHTRRVFVAVGPSEADKAAAVKKTLQEKQQAEEAAKDFAAKTAAVAATAEKDRIQAVAVAALAGQSQTVSSAQNVLNAATADASHLKMVSDNALKTANETRQAAIDAAPAALEAEKKYQALLVSINGLKLKNGQYGTEKWEVIGSSRENDHYGFKFRSSGITSAQVDAAKTDAASKRHLANTLPLQAVAAEQSSLKATADWQAAETRRQSAQAALIAAQQAAAKTAEAERQRLAAELAAVKAAEQKRQAEAAAKAAEDARIAAEEAKAKQARQAAADKLKNTNIQSVRGIPLTATPETSPVTWAVASTGGVVLDSTVATAVWSRIAAGLAELRSIASASLAGPVATTVVGLFWSEEVGTGSDIVPGRDISSLIPGNVLSLPDANTLNRAADMKTGVAMPVRGLSYLREDGVLETRLVRTPVVGSVPVVRAELDPETGYWGYALPKLPGVPGQTIFISPSDAPGINEPTTLTGPVPLPERIVHTGDHDAVLQGATVMVTPIADEPELSDIILIFPGESGLQPLYVMLRSPRNMPGTVTGDGQQVGDNWLGGAGTEGSPIPSQVADKLRGREFSNFDAFRRAVWKAVSDTSELSEQFKRQNKTNIKNGLSPFVPESERVGGRQRFELHHVTPVSKGGAVYDVDGIRVTTPKRHIEIHKGDK